METAEIINSTPPALLQFKGDWETFQDELYIVFLNTIYNSKLYFLGLPVSVKRHPEYKDKHFTFWHLTSEGEKEAERTPDLKRCERLTWVSWVILNSDKHPELSYWENKRGSETHVVIWFEKENYAVVLGKRNGYYLLKTAYCLNERRANAFKKDRTQSLGKGK